MPIQFVCPSCARGYSVKDELAGKSAKCGQCGHKMKIPAASAKSVAGAGPAPKSSAVRSAATSAPAKRVAAKSTAVRTAAASVAKAKPVEPAAADTGMSSWLDEELETARVEAKAKPQAPPSDASCPSCDGPMTPGAVICVKCGYDTRIRGRRSVEHVDENKEAPKRSKLGHMGSLLRGTFFSFLAAMLGAIIWAVLAYFTNREFGIVAWGLGGLAGLGMALGHEDDDGTFAGIIAAFMSLVGIVAAKVFIVIILIAAAVSTIVNELPLGESMDAVESQRSALALAMAAEEMQEAGQHGGDADMAQWQAAIQESRAEIADLTPEEIEARFNALAEEQSFDGEDEDFDDFDDEEFADEDGAAIADEEFAFEEADDDVTFGSVVGSLFGPMDGLFILLAFFTAYKVGAGQADD
jgi:hypothetical protein